ncbi:hypothetical protein J6590_040235 [Homalodisca vitripennis]|nr:hypothetical protein J6590_040235 [Homalodisca vitripennis]
MRVSISHMGISGCFRPFYDAPDEPIIAIRPTSETECTIYITDLETSIQVLQCEYDDPLSTPRQKKPVSRTVGPRPGPWTYCPPLKK